jgi:hypothetical protein
MSEEAEESHRLFFAGERRKAPSLQPPGGKSEADASAGRER